MGLISAISTYLATLQINIVEMREHVDQEEGLFFARLGLSCESVSPEWETGLRKVLPPSAVLQIHSAVRKRFAVFVTKEHHCLSDLLVRHHFNTGGFEIVGVIGNYENLGDLCAKFNVPFRHVSHENVTRSTFEDKLIEQLDQFQFDYLVLAKFMRILSPEFVKRYPEKIINIHHSFLPAFIGANPYRQAFVRGVKLIGATSHYVTNELDEGPIIVQQTIRVDHSDSAAKMMKAGREVETSVLSHTLNLISENRVLVNERKTVVFE